MTRAEHLEWCKDRALEYLDAGDIQRAFTSLVSDLRNHPGTQGHVGIQLGMNLLMIGDLNTSEKMRKFIEGFN